MATGNYEKIIDHYGADAQKVKAIEELSELQKEIAKDLIGQGSIENVAEEIADVQIMLRQLQMIYGIDYSDLNKIMSEKTLRTLYRIAVEEKEDKEKRKWER